MRVCKFRDLAGGQGYGVIEADGQVRVLPGAESLEAALKAVLAGGVPGALVTDVELVAPVDGQEIWAAGVTYRRSQQARREESEGAARFYDRVYAADRPELFFKATARRAVGGGEIVRVRADSAWSVPEPELTLWLDRDLQLIGLGLGNDMSARDIEGENPLYLPQAKIYSGACALGPDVLACDDFAELAGIEITLTIARAGETVYTGSTAIDQLNREPADLVEWLGRQNDFPEGVVLMTGTGIVPPDEFTLVAGDVIEIAGTGLGTLTNPVAIGVGR